MMTAGLVVETVCASVENDEVKKASLKVRHTTLEMDAGEVAGPS